MGFLDDLDSAFDNIMGGDEDKKKGEESAKEQPAFQPFEGMPDELAQLTLVS